MPTAPASRGDPRMLELKLKEQLRGLAPACGRRMWLGSADSDMRARDAASPAMFARRCKTVAAPRRAGPVYDRSRASHESAANQRKACNNFLKRPLYCFKYVPEQLM